MSRMMLRRRTRKKMRWQFSTYSGIEFPWLCELSSAEKSICSMKSELAKPKEMFSNWKRGRKNEGIENSKEREDTFSLWTLPEVGDNDFAFVISDFRLFFLCPPPTSSPSLYLTGTFSTFLFFVPSIMTCTPSTLLGIFIFSYTIGMMSVHICCCYQPNVLACATQPNGLTIQWMRFYRA